MRQPELDPALNGVSIPVINATLEPFQVLQP